MNSLAADVRYAVRKLVRAPLFALIAILTLGLGIGLNTAIFSVVYGVLMRPLPFDRPGELVRVNTVLRGDPTWRNSGSSYLELAADPAAFQGLLLYSGATQTLTGRGEPTEVQTAVVSANFFDVLGVPPVRGRTFAAGENEPGQSDVAVISSAFWQEQFGGDDAAIGSVVVLNGRLRRIIGVAPAGMRFPEGASAWMPVDYTPEMRSSQFGQFNFHVLGRLRPGSSLEQARAEVVAQAGSVAERNPQLPDMSADVQPLLAATTGDVRTPLFVLLGAVGFVLLIACANIANLLLARATARASEFAVRRALGAGRGSIVQQLLVESVVLAVAGGLLGVCVALWATEALVALSPQGLPRLDEIRVDGAVLLFALGASVLTGLLFGMVPAMHMVRGSTAASLRTETRNVAGGNGARNALVVVEMALAVVLLAGAGLLVASFVRLMDLEPGIDVDDAVAVHVWLPPADFPDNERVRLFYENVTTSLAALPGVHAAGAVQTLPLAGSGTQLGFFAADDPPATPDDMPVSGLRAITPDYFRTAGIRLIRGRGIEDGDRHDTPRAMVLSQTAARRLFPDGSALGRVVELTYGIDGEPVRGEVVGIAQDTKVNSLGEAPQPLVYVAHAQLPMRSMELVVRAGPGSMSLAPAIREEIHRLGPNLPVNVRPLQYLVDDALARARFFTLLLGTFAAAALVLAAVGIFGVFSYTVAQRRREIGIRIALGARESTVIRMVVDRAGRLAGAGIFLGVVAALLLTRFLGDLLFGVTATDPLTFAAVALLLLAVALVASYIPARSAARLDPLDALRME